MRSSLPVLMIVGAAAIATASQIHASASSIINVPDHRISAASSRPVLHTRETDAREEGGQELHQLKGRGGGEDILSKAIRKFGLAEDSSWEKVLAHVDSYPDTLHEDDGFKKWERNYLRRRPDSLKAVASRRKAVKADSRRWLDHLLGQRLYRQTRVLKKLTNEQLDANKDEHRRPRASQVPLAAETELRRPVELEAVQSEADKSKKQRLEKKLAALEATRALKEASEEELRKAERETAAQEMRRAIATIPAAGKQGGMTFGNDDFVTRWKAKQAASLASAASTSKPTPAELPARRRPSSPLRISTSTTPATTSDQATISKAPKRSYHEVESLDQDAPPPKKTTVRLFGQVIQAP